MRPTVRWRILAGALKDAWPIWLALGGTLLAFTAGRLVSTTLSTAVRYAGTVLQVLGLMTVAIGLRQMRRLFDRPSLGARISRWFGRLAAAFTGPKTISLQGLSVGGSGSLAGEVRVVRGIRPGAALDERVSVLEENLQRLRDELDTKMQGVRRRLDGVTEDMQRERRERQAADESTARRIEEVAIGGLHLEMVGLWWLVLGVLGTSVPDEIAAWLSLVA